MGRRHPVGRQRDVLRFSVAKLIRFRADEAEWLEAEADRLGVSEAEVVRRVVGWQRAMSEERSALVGAGF